VTGLSGWTIAHLRDASIPQRRLGRARHARRQDDKAFVFSLATVSPGPTAPSCPYGVEQPSFFEVDERALSFGGPAAKGFFLHTEIASPSAFLGTEGPYRPKSAGPYQQERSRGNDPRCIVSDDSLPRWEGPSSPTVSTGTLPDKVGVGGLRRAAAAEFPLWTAPALPSGHGFCNGNVVGAFVAFAFSLSKPHNASAKQCSVFLCPQRGPLGSVQFFLL